MKNTFKLNLEQQKKQAKELLQKTLNGDTDALDRFAKHHPKLIHKECLLDEFIPKLSDAQLVIARELGCKTWSQLKHHTALMDSLRHQVESAETVLDEPKECLHIRCGSDIEKILPQAGFTGDFLEFSDPLCVGPVSYNYDVKERAHFLYESYGNSTEQTSEAILTKLTQAYEQFRYSTSNYKHIVLWFEHDPYDQFILMFLLSQYSRFGSPKNLWIVTTNSFPGSSKFKGLGQLPPEGLRLLWQTRQQLDRKDCEEADQHWAAYTNPNRDVFAQHIANQKDSRFPYFKNAALRQLLEQPVDEGTLPLTQKITLEMLSDTSPQTAGALFKHITEHKEPLPFLGDIMYWHILQQMEKKELVLFAKTAEQWHDTVITLE